MCIHQVGFKLYRAPLNWIGVFILWFVTIRNICWSASARERVCMRIFASLPMQMDGTESKQSNASNEQRHKMRNGIRRNAHWYGALQLCICACTNRLQRVAVIFYLLLEKIYRFHAHAKKWYLFFDFWIIMQIYHDKMMSPIRSQFVGGLGKISWRAYTIGHSF